MRKSEAQALFKEACEKTGPAQFCCRGMDIATAMYDAEAADRGPACRGFGIPLVWGHRRPAGRARAPRLRTQGGVLLASFCPFCGHKYEQEAAPKEPPVRKPAPPEAVPLKVEAPSTVSPIPDFSYDSVGVAYLGRYRAHLWGDGYYRTAYLIYRKDKGYALVGETPEDEWGDLHWGPAPDFSTFPNGDWLLMTVEEGGIIQPKHVAAILSGQGGT